jgi:hypothetical protein
MDLAKRMSLSAEAERLRKAGHPVEAILQKFRDQGLSKLESVAVLAGCPDSDLGEAKRVVHESAVWADVKPRDDAIFDELDEPA